jgi:catechol 2,3-dioxygenase-like lactoylglutathione lyase family enzyme
MNNQGGSSMPAISRLGHVGLHVQDLERAKQFYCDILGLSVTDEDAEEHHELAPFGGRNVGADALVLQQLSFRFDTDRPKDEIVRQVEESVRKHGRTGFIDPTIIRERKVLARSARGGGAS